MISVSVEELTSQKILKFNLYNELGEKIMNAGEIITPGKLLQLHHISALYREDTESEQEIEYNLQDSKEETPAQPPETFIDTKSRRSISSLFTAALTETSKNESVKTADLCIEARDRIVEQVLPNVNDVVYKSELKVQGDYNYSHGINVSMLSTMLASKLGYNEQMVKDIALGAMLCDIGKARLPKGLFDKDNPTKKEKNLIKMHPVLGYKILMEEMDLPEHIAKIVLEHHERNDGSGYPNGISGDTISPAAQIVIVCDVYDDLTSRRGPVIVKNSKEAVKVMLEIGSRWFAPNVLYSFVYMSNFNDLTPT